MRPAPRAAGTAAPAAQGGQRQRLDGREPQAPTTPPAEFPLGAHARPPAAQVPLAAPGSSPPRAAGGAAPGQTTVCPVPPGLSSSSMTSPFATAHGQGPTHQAAAGPPPSTGTPTELAAAATPTRSAATDSAKRPGKGALQSAHAADDPASQPPESIRAVSSLPSVASSSSAAAAAAAGAPGGRLPGTYRSTLRKAAAGSQQPSAAQQQQQPAAGPAASSTHASSAAVVVLDPPSDGRTPTAQHAAPQDATTAHGRTAAAAAAALPAGELHGVEQQGAAAARPALPGEAEDRPQEVAAAPPDLLRSDSTGLPPQPPASRRAGLDAGNAERWAGCSVGSGVEVACVPVSTAINQQQGVAGVTTDVRPRLAQYT